MQETGPFPRHGIFITAREVKHPIGDWRQIGLDRHEAVIAVDHHPGPLGTGQRRQLVQRGDDSAGIEQDLAGKYQIEFSRSGCIEQIIWRHRLQDDLSGLDPALHLPAKAVKFAVGCQHLCRSFRDGGQYADDEIMGIGRKAQCCGIGQIQFSGDMLLRFGPDGTHDLGPFVIGQHRRVFPGRHMAVMARVGPEMVAMRGKMQTIRIGRERFGEQKFPAHNWVRSDHSSGKARLPTVLCK